MHTAAPVKLPEPASLEEARRIIADLAHQLQVSQWQVAQFKKQLFGPSADRVPPADENLSQEQRLLAMFPEPSEPSATQDVVLPEEPGQREPARKGPVRNPQPKVVETVVERIEPEQKVCEHCGKLKCEIGCERSERYEYVPARIVRHEIVRPKLACPCGQGTVTIAPLPATVIDKGLPGPGLVTQVTLAKYDDHIPLYRQQKQLERLGVYFPRNTLCGWVERVAEWLQPVVAQIKRELLAGDYLQVDETPVRVLDPEVEGKCAKGYLWVAGRPGGDVIFEFYPGRGAEEARKLMGGFGGYLQRDGYSVYGSLANAPNSGLIPCGCLAHGRRKFVEALADEPQPVRWFVEEIRKLYVIEAHAREEDLLPEQRLALRQELAPPIWSAIKTRLDELNPTLLPKSPLGKAVRYALNEWEAWQTYLRDGRIEIDNNLIENAIRPSAVGKKNFLFIGHPDAGWRSAVIYSIIVSCRRRKIDPWLYIKDMVTRLPKATNQQIAEFVPARWKPTAA
jgi:transposase